MDPLLQFARGPVLQLALIVFLVGTLWRLFGIVLLKGKNDLSEPRGRSALMGALKTIATRSYPLKPFRRVTAFAHWVGYAFHIGLFVVILGFGPHILFIKDLTGLSWPSLPNGVIYFAGVVTVAALVAALIRRITHPVTRLISNFDDYFSWLVTVLPVVTGLTTNAHLFVRYETMLAIHLLSVEALLIWMPFGKLMHTFLSFVSRGTTGALFAHKGVQS